MNYPQNNPQVMDDATAIIMHRDTTDGTRDYRKRGLTTVPQFDTLPAEVRAAFLTKRELIGYGKLAYDRARELCELENGLIEIGVL